MRCCPAFRFVVFPRGILGRIAPTRESFDTQPKAPARFAPSRRLRLGVKRVRAIAVLGGVLPIVLATTNGSSANVGGTSAATMYWANGDVLSGRLLGLSGSQVQWQSASFATPLSIDLRYLDCIQFPRTDDQSTTDEPLRFAIDTGDELFGRLVDLTRDYLMIHSVRHGRCTIPRAKVLSFRRAYGQSSYEAPNPVAGGRHRIQLLDGGVVYGRILRYDRSVADLVVAGSSNGIQRIKLDRVAGVFLSNSVNDSARGGSGIQITYLDGTRLSGAIESVRDDRIVLRTAFADLPVPCPFQWAHELKFLGEKKRTGDSRHVMQVEGGTLHGWLAVRDPASAGFSWRPMGGASPSPLASGCRARIKGQANGGRRFAAASRYPDVVHLRSGDVVSCRLVSSDPKHFYLDSVVGRNVPLLREEVKAVEFNAQLDYSVFGFGDPAWLVTQTAQQTLQRTDERLVFRGQATMQHKNILCGDSLSFDASWGPSEPAALTVSMFADSVDQARDNMMLVLFSGTLLEVRAAKQPARAGGRRGVVKMNRFPGHRANLRFAFREGSLRVFVDGRQVLTRPITQEEQSRRGIILSLHPVKRRRLPDGQDTVLLAISNFQIGRSDDVTRDRHIDGDKKKLVLTLPRHQRNNPPTHVLVAHNGDLVRGGLIGVNSEHVVFNSRHEDCIIPRERLASIICLDRTGDVDSSTRNSARGVVTTVLRDGSTLTFIPERVQDGKLVVRSSNFGRCAIALGQIHELRVGRDDARHANVAYADWKLQPAEEPRFAVSTPDSRFATDSPIVGTAAPDFQAELLRGGRFQLSQHSDKVVVLDFWATWCSPCVTALPQIVAATDAYWRDQLVFVAVNQQETAAAVEEFLAVRGLDAPVVLDRDGNIGRQFRVEAIPQTVVIGKGGKIEGLHVGANPNLQEELSSLLRRITSDRDSS